MSECRGATVREKYKNYTTVDLGVNYVWEKQHHFSLALNNVFDTGIEWTHGVDNKGNEVASSWANAYRDYIEGRNLWLSYAYTF